MSANAKKHGYIILGLGLVLALSGCNDSGAKSSSIPDATSVSQHPQQEQKTTIVGKMNRQEQIDFAKHDLITRLAIDPKKVSLTRAVEVTWRSGALGCPEPGTSYTQALVPGVLIVFSAGNSDYRYHARTGGQPFLCPEERAEIPIRDSRAD